MWLFSDEGFISAVAYRDKEDSKTRSKRQRKSWGKNPVLLRARLEKDLEQVRPYWSKLRIEDDDSADYEFRAIVPRTRWVDFLMHKGDEIDYVSHFKEVAEKRSPGGPEEGKLRHDAMMRVWSNMATLQPAAPYSGTKWYKTYKYGGGKYGGAGWEWPDDGDDNIAYSYATLCTKFVIESRQNETYKIWCIKKNNHPGACDFRTKALVKVDNDKEVDKTANETAITTYAYDSTNPLNAPDTVEAMCKELYSKTPEDIFVDSATPYYAYDLWATACESAHSGPLTASEIIDILDELAEDDLTTEQARNMYKAALDTFTSRVFDDSDIVDAEEVWDTESLTLL